MNKIIEQRIANQLRIHWAWLKNSSHEDATKFIIATINGTERRLNQKITFKDFVIENVGAAFYYAAINQMNRCGKTEEEWFSDLYHDYQMLYSITPVKSIVI
jgi:hypothetical protein